MPSDSGQINELIDFAIDIIGLNTHHNKDMKEGKLLMKLVTYVFHVHIPFN